MASLQAALACPPLSVTKVAGETSLPSKELRCLQDDLTSILSPEYRSMQFMLVHYAQDDPVLDPWDTNSCRTALNVLS